MSSTTLSPIAAQAPTDERRAVVAAKVAVVIVNFRTPGLTIDCVRSLRSVTYSPLEIIVVDNASGDDSAARFQAEVPHVHLVTTAENGGYTRGNNLGIDEALRRGAEFVLVLNPDTVVIQPGFVDRLVSYLCRHAGVGAVGPRVYLHRPGNVQNTVLRFPWLWRRLVDWGRYRLSGPDRRSGDKPCRAEVLNGVCVLFRRECLVDVGGFDEATFAYIEDIDWAWRAQRRGWQSAYLPVDSILHLQKESGYQRAGGVDFLLKRNTLYFLLKTNHRWQAAGFVLATLAVACLEAALQRLRGVRAAFDWPRKLARAYAAVWRGRAGAMGRPGC